LASSWNHFTTLLDSGSDLSLQDPILLQHFYKGLHRDNSQFLNTTSRGSFLHLSSEKARLILDQILASEYDNILEVEPQVAEPNPLPNIPSTSATPCSEPPKEKEIPFPDFMLDIETDLFADFGNISNYYSIKKPQNHRKCFGKSLDLSKGSSYKSASRELVSIISNEWLEESELSSDVIHLDSPSIPIRCQINSDYFDALYNLVVDINIMSASLAQNLLKHMPLCNTLKLTLF
jgi:hypothetical protein